MTRGVEWLDTAERVARLTHESDIKYLATAIAYYGFVSIVPLLLLGLAVVGSRWTGDLPASAGDVSAQAAGLVTPDARGLLYEALATASGRTGAVVLSVVVLAWSLANVATGFLTAVERVEAATERPLTTQVRDAVIVLVALSVAILAVLFQTLFLALFSSRLLEILVGAAALLAVLTVAFLPLYYVPSRLLGSLSAAFPGALTAACGWSLIYGGLQTYVVNAAQYAIYGVLSGVILILTSIYLAAVVLMIGVVVNTVVAVDPNDLPGTGR